MPLCIIALVIGFAGELAVLGPNIALERGATAGWLIGSSAGLQACGIVLSGPLASYLLGRIGSGRVLALAASLCIAAIAGLALSETALIIAAYRFVFAIGLGAATIVSQHVLLVRAPTHAKARTLALFSFFTSLGSMMVPGLIHQVNGNLTPVYAAGAFGLLTAIFCGAAAFRSGRSEPISLSDVWGVPWRIGVGSLFSGVLYGALTNGFSAFLAVYAIRAGYSVADASALALAGLIGTCALELPIGWLCDRYKPWQVIGGLGAIVALLMVALLCLPHAWALLLALAVALGGFCNALYLGGLLQMRPTRPAEIAAGTSCFISACGFGEIAGPVLGGSTLQLFGLQGFLLAFLGVVAVYFGALATVNSGWRKSARMRTSPAPPLMAGIGTP